MDKYSSEVSRRFGDTDAYREYTEKTKNYTGENYSEAAAGLMAIFGELASVKKNGDAPDCAEAQSLVLKLQRHITDRWYTCTDEILAGLGKMYTADVRFKENIDSYGDGTAEFASEAIRIFTEK